MALIAPPRKNTDAAVATFASTPHRSKKVVYHGDLVEFLDHYRCESCATGKRKCIIQQRERSCMLCSDAGRPCLFTRTVQLKGHAGEFSWDTLLSDGSQSEDARNLKPTSGIQSSGSEPGQDEYEHIPSSISPGSLPLSSNADQGISVETYNATEEFPHSFKTIPYGFQPLPFTSSLPPFNPGRATMGILPPAKSDNINNFTPTTSIPILPQALRPNVEYQNITESGQEIRTLGTVKSKPLNLPESRTPISANKRPFTEIESSLSISGEAAGFKTQRNELQPDPEAVGASKITESELRITYVCINISDDKDFLKGCKQCESGKEYKYDYNAGEHLRRIHFNKRSKGRRGQDDRDRRGGKGGGAGPSMTELRKWMKKIETRIEIPAAPGISTTLQKHSERASSSVSTTSNSDLMERYNPWIECPECGMKFRGKPADRKSNMRRHIATQHEDQIPLSCNHCSRKFLNQWNLTRHVAKYHEGISTQQDSPISPGKHAKESDIPMSTAD